MTYQVPESKRSLEQNQFHFLIGDVEYTIPKAKFLTTRQVEKLSSVQGDLTIADILDLFDASDASDAVRDLDTEQLQGLLVAWQADSDLTVGESSVSS